MSEIALARDVDAEHLDPDDVAGLDHLARVGDEGPRHRGDVHEAVLVHADVDERAERRHVGDDALQHHAGRQVLQRLHALRERGRRERRARVAAGLLQLAQDVGDGRQAERVVGEVRAAAARAAPRCCRSARACWSRRRPRIRRTTG